MSIVYYPEQGIEEFEEEKKSLADEHRDIEDRIRMYQLEEKLKKLAGEYEAHLDSVSDRIVNDIVTMLRGRRLSPQAYQKIRNVLDSCINPGLDENFRKEFLAVADMHFGKMQKDKEFIEKNEMEM